MQLAIDIPDDIAAHLWAQSDDLARGAVEQIALGGYLAGTLSRFQVQRLLGFDNRWETEDWLGSRGAAMQYSIDELELDRTNLDRLLGR